MPDGAAISALVAEHDKWLMAFLRGLAGDAAEDAFQETWMRVIRATANRVPDSWKAYLAKTARSVVIDRLRRHRPVESLDAAAEQEEGGGFDPVDESPGPAERYESKATAEDVRKAVAALPFELREVVLLRIEGEMEFKDIAAELGIPLGTALTRMRRATLELKKKLGGA